MSTHETEVLIVGGGILGAATARELSKYKVDTTLVEKETDWGWGSTKANIGLVCQGGDCLEFRKEYHRSKLVWDSIPMMEPLCQELEVSFKRVGMLGVFMDDEQKSKFGKMKSRAEQVGITSHQWIDRDTLFDMEPYLSKKALGALYDPVPAIIDPVKLNIALAENAKQNGVHTMLGTKVIDISRGVEGFEVRTNNGPIKTSFIVNAAGVYVDKVARMVNADNFVVYPIKGYLGILDKRVGGLVRHNIWRVAPGPGEMNIVEPTVDGNIIFGIQLMQAKRDDLSTTREMAAVALKRVQDMVPAISGKDVIKFFVGFMMMRNFELGWHDCVVEASPTVPQFINVTIGYPGLSACPATAKEIVKLLADQELNLVEKANFNPKRREITDFSQLSDDEKRKLIAQDAKYGHVVCRCETVTEGEIVEAIKRGATTVDGIKYRTRAGTGRCQSGFCRSRVISILARELGISDQEVTMAGGKSQELLYRDKELLEGGESICSKKLM